MQKPYSFRSETIHFSVLVPHVENLAAVELETAGFGSEVVRAAVRLKAPGAKIDYLGMSVEPSSDSLVPLSLRQLPGNTKGFIEAKPAHPFARTHRI